jgi:hypothetical protein
MNRKAWMVPICARALVVAVGCSKNKSAPELIVEIPSGYAGNFSLEMGVKDAPALSRQGISYVVTVPKSGKIATSTLLTNSRPIFKNASDGAVWGYSHLVFATGDGIPIGAKIEFFVGTRKEFDAEQGKKNHSGGFSAVTESSRVGA